MFLDDRRMGDHIGKNYILKAGCLMPYRETVGFELEGPKSHRSLTCLPLKLV